MFVLLYHVIEWAVTNRINKLKIGQTFVKDITNEKDEK